MSEIVTKFYEFAEAERTSVLHLVTDGAPLGAAMEIEKIAFLAYLAGAGYDKTKGIDEYKEHLRLKKEEAKLQIALKYDTFTDEQKAIVDIINLIEEINNENRNSGSRH